MGHDVYYLEDTRVWPIFQEGCGTDCRPNVEHLHSVMSAFGLGERWAYRDDASGTWYGPVAGRAREVIRTADILVNVSCATDVRDDYLEIPIRILVDSDPMFTQIQATSRSGHTPDSAGPRLHAHTHHFSFGESIGQADCRVPECGIRWRPTRQPICLEAWPVTPLPSTPSPAFTTVMNWSALQSVEWGGESWGQKDREFLRVVDLPGRLPEARFAIAMGQRVGPDFPAARIQRAGWEVLDPEEWVPTWSAYRAFIARSLGEWSVAKATYVQARTGWFSCRSACYLASGRPVVLQDTGWTRHLPSGDGLLSFTDSAGAAAAVSRVLRDPHQHARRAREIAEEYFDSRKVLARLLSDAGGRAG
jgi:hypothetical protein